MQEEIQSSEQTAVRAVLQRFIDAWNRHDPRELAAPFAPDGEWIDVLGEVMQGPAEIERGHIYPFTTVLKLALLTVHQQHLKWLRPDVVLAELTWTTDGNLALDGQPLPARNGLMILGLTREQGQWLIVSGHNVDYTATYRRADLPEDRLKSFQRKPWE